MHILLKIMLKSHTSFEKLCDSKLKGTSSDPLEGQILLGSYSNARGETGTISRALNILDLKGEDGFMFLVVGHSGNDTVFYMKMCIHKSKGDNLASQT